MKRIYVIMALVLACLVPAMGQNKEKKSKEEMRREIAEFKLKYLCQEMELTAEQKEKFTPLYESMSGERWKVFKETHDLEKRVRKSKGADNAEYEALVKAMNNAKERDAEITSRYDKQFAKFLSAKQIYKMKEAEEEFGRRMRKMRNDRKGRPAKIEKFAPDVE